MSLHCVVAAKMCLKMNFGLLLTEKVVLKFDQVHSSFYAGLPQNKFRVYFHGNTDNRCSFWNRNEYFVEPIMKMVPKKSLTNNLLRTCGVKFCNKTGKLFVSTCMADCQNVQKY